MTRKYELKRRAERQAETRRRIVEAAVDLHARIGPVRTTVSAVAERAGVQRHTVYSHFPDERTLGYACSGLYLERNPLPDPEAWRRLHGETRLRHGLGELYAYFDRNQRLLTNVLRDAEIHDLTRETLEVRVEPTLERIREVLAEAVPEQAAPLALLDLAVDFYAWRRLAWSGLTPHEAAETMTTALRCR